MTDSSARIDPFSDVISLVAGPIAAVIRSFDQLRKGADEMRRGFENFNTTMENLNETAERINRLLNDFEEPVRAMIPQVTRTVKLADELSKRLATPIDQVAPGLQRLASALNSPVLTTLPTDLGQFQQVINELSKRLSPLTQFADQATNLFGLRIPGMSARPAASPTTAAAAAAPAPEPQLEPEPPRRAPAAKKATTKAPARKRTSTAKKASATRKSPATKKAATKKAAAR